MKNQYFADTRDLFKYDLVLELLSKLKLRNFTFMPMLTPDEPQYRGGRTDYEHARAGTKRTELRNFLQTCLDRGNRKVIMLEHFFRKSDLTKNLCLTIYRKDEYFTHANRRNYFARVAQKLISNSVILIDPDIGLEVVSINSVNGERYILYREVRSLYRNMSIDSILLIFQFIPRVNRERYLLDTCRKIKEDITHPHPAYCISDHQVAFFTLAKNSRLLDEVSDHLHGYSALYGLHIYRA